MDRHPTRSPTFKHIPLSDPCHIRLLWLHGGEGETPISCNIEPVDIARAEAYEALSYTWGSPTDKCSILINNHRFDVTQNLFTALKHLRRKEHPRILWIDALCINQDDLEERSSQVQRMKNIYESANLVTVWLGPAADDSTMAMRMLLEITGLFRTHRAVLSAPFAGSELASELLIKFLAFGDRGWKALAALLDRPWWSRVWIVQEATSSVDTVFYCGETWQPREVIFLAATALQQFGRHPELARLAEKHQVKISQPLGLLNITLSRSGMLPPYQAADILGMFRRYDATDQRDHVYAPLGLAAPRTSEIKVDYRKSTAEVFADIVQLEIENAVGFGHQLDILGFCHGYSRPELNLPSWVPDFSIEPYLTPFAKRLVQSDSAQTAYSASGKTLDAIQKFEPSFLTAKINNGMLQVNGIMVDEIESVSEESLNGLHEETEKSWAPKDGETIYFTGETRYEAYLRTIVADVQLKSTRAVSRNASMVWSESDNVNDESHASLKLHCCNRRLAFTKSGAVGLVRWDVQPHDLVVVLLGGQMLYILRPEPPVVSSGGFGTKERSDGGQSKGITSYKFLGECYVHGMMDGEVLQRLDLQKDRFSTLQLT